MNTLHDVLGRLETILIGQIELLDLLAERERELQNHLLNRNWQELEQLIEEMTAISRQIQAADTARNDSFRVLRVSMGLPDGSGMSEVISRLDEESGNTLRMLYRNLKVAVMRIQSLTGGIDAYVASSTATMRAFLEQSFPDRRGTIYSRDGSADHNAGHAVVVDRHL